MMSDTPQLRLDIPTPQPLSHIYDYLVSLSVAPEKKDTEKLSSHTLSSEFIKREEKKLYKTLRQLRDDFAITHPNMIMPSSYSLKTLATTAIAIFKLNNDDPISFRITGNHEKIEHLLHYSQLHFEFENNEEIHETTLEQLFSNNESFTPTQAREFVQLCLLKLK